MTVTSDALISTIEWPRIPALIPKDLIDKYEDIELVDYDKVLKWVYAKITNNIHEYNVIMNDGISVDYYHLSLEDGMMELDDLYIFDEYQNQGIGTYIINKILNEYDDVFIYVFKKNINAIRLYERMGFRKTKDIKTRIIMEYHKRKMDLR